ncbi:MAG TPA: hypothetical protein VFY70_00425 [Thermomicrobiales bacterium]|nr:hypothetical protein [Thermomicrobiales bacterium]
MPEQQGSAEVHVSPSGLQQNLPAMPLTTVRSHLSERQQRFPPEPQVRPTFLQRAASAPCGVAAMTSDARLATAARPNRRRVQVSNRFPSMRALLRCGDLDPDHVGIVMPLPHRRTALPARGATGELLIR